MVDTLTPQQRSQQMALVRSQDTKPEWFVRSLLHQQGYRYRLHSRDLPGSPDLVFRSRNKVIFVHGCFWHRHNCKMGNRLPKTRVEFWEQKLSDNKRRDARNRRKLRRLGWDLFVIWECQILRWSDEQILAALESFLEDA
jgi:DNA mismatch endonuclease (patch repair protein)